MIALLVSVWLSAPSWAGPIDCETPLLATHRLMDFEHDFHPMGFVRLTEIVGPRAKANGYAERILPQLLAQHPETDFKNGDILISLDIRGERNGVLRRLVEATVSDATMDLTGVGAYMVQYRADPFSERIGTPRVVIVVKQSAKDYRQDASGTLQNPEQIASWIGVQVEDTLREYFNLQQMEIYLGTSKFEAAYRWLGLTKEGTYLDKDTFIKAYNKARWSFLAGLTGTDRLMIRPSFWDARPEADAFVEKAFPMLAQKPVDFSSYFTERALLLRERLHAAVLHNTPTTRFNYRMAPGSAKSSLPDPVVFPSGRDVMDKLPSQFVYGSDFRWGDSYLNTSADELIVLTDNPQTEHAVERLVEHGYNQLADLSGAPVENLMRDAGLSLDDVVELGKVLVERGIYFRYSWETLRKLPSDLRTYLRGPRHQYFEYNPKSNGYRLKKKSEDKPGRVDGVED